MKNKKLENFGLVMLLSLLFGIPSVLSLGIPTPFPHNLRMMRGDTTDFRIRIQAVNEPTRLSCSPYVQDFDPLIITFNEETVTVEPGEIKDVWGTVTIPSNAEIKTYEGRVYATCAPAVKDEDISGSSITKTPGNLWSLSVVATEAERNIPTVTTQPMQEIITPAYPPSLIITIIIIIAVIVIAVYYLSEKEKKKSKK